MPLVAGDLFGRFRILASAGRGGMGEVFKAEDTSLRRVVALKTIRADALALGSPTEAAQGVARFEREARVLAAFAHPNVVQIFSFELIEGTHVLCMEWLEGQMLRDVVRDGEASLERRLTWLIEAASALAALHRAGIIHRDLKPANLMIGRDGQLRILDFGIARILDQSAIEAASGGAHLTRTHDVIGTPRYMAPEQRLGARVDGRADQFAWGLVAYELLTWIHPRELAPEESRSHFPIAPPPSPRTIEPRIPAHVSEVVLRALSLEPGDRFPSMDALVAQLGAAAPSDPPRDPGRTRARGAAPSPKRIQPRTIFVASAGLVVAVGAVAALALWPRTSDSVSDIDAHAPQPVTDPSDAFAADSATDANADTVTAAPLDAGSIRAAPGPSHRPLSMAWRAIVLHSPERHTAGERAMFAEHTPALLRCYRASPPLRACDPAVAEAEMRCKIEGGTIVRCDASRVLIGGVGRMSCTLDPSVSQCLEKTFTGARISGSTESDRSDLAFKLHPIE